MLLRHDLNTGWTLRATGGPVPPAIALSAYRIVQESLTNALKHAGPASAVVTVRVESSTLLVEVSDDGTFYTVLRLRQEGINQLRIVAQDAVGNQEVKTHQAYVETF